jgi:hypothetical protein
MAGTGARSSRFRVGALHMPTVQDWNLSHFAHWAQGEEMNVRVRDRMIGVRINETAQLSLARDTYIKAIKSVFGAEADASLACTEFESETIWSLTIATNSVLTIGERVAKQIAVHDLVSEQTPALAGFFALRFDGDA